MDKNIVSAIRENYDPNLLAKGSSILFELDGIHYHLYEGDFRINLVRLKDVASASLRFTSDDFFWSVYAARCAIFSLFLKIPAMQEELQEMSPEYISQLLEEADKLSPMKSIEDAFKDFNLASYGDLFLIETGRRVRALKLEGEKVIVYDMEEVISAPMENLDDLARSMERPFDQFLEDALTDKLRAAVKRVYGECAAKFDGSVTFKFNGLFYIAGVEGTSLTIKSLPCKVIRETMLNGELVRHVDSIDGGEVIHTGLDIDTDIEGMLEETVAYLSCGGTKDAE